MNITLNLDVEISYDRIPAEIGGKDDAGNVEYTGTCICLTSVIYKGIELISLLSAEEKLSIEQEIEEKEN